MIKLSELLDKVGQEDADINNNGIDNDKTDKYLKRRRDAIAKNKNLNEEDHEVSMAQSSLKDIAKAAIELAQKIGGIERNIPGWIQNHITNAENYIEQAAQGFHELKQDKMNELKRMQQLAGVINESQINEEAVPAAQWKSALINFIQTNLTEDIAELDILNEVLREIIADNEEELSDPANQDYLGQDGPEPTQQELDDETAADQFDPNR